MAIIKILCCHAPTTSSTEILFSGLNRVKTDLRNMMGDDRMSDLTFIHMKIYNKCVYKNSHTNKRVKLFVKCVPKDLERIALRSPDAINITVGAETVPSPPNLVLRTTLKFNICSCIACFNTH